MKKNIIIGILSFLFLIAICFITYDKLFKKDNCQCQSCEKSDSSKEEPISIDSEALSSEIYYNDLLGTFLKHLYNIAPESVDNFSNEEIETYLFFYYLDYASRYELLKYDEKNLEMTYNINKKDVDNIVLKTFGKKNFQITNVKDKRTGLRNLDNNTYQVFAFPTASDLTLYKFNSSAYDEESDITKVEYTLYYNPSAGEGEGVIGTVTFYLTGQDHIVNKIKYDTDI